MFSAEIIIIIIILKKKIYWVRLWYVMKESEFQLYVYSSSLVMYKWVQQHCINSHSWKFYSICGC